MPDKLLWLIKPTEGTWPTATWHQWTTRCGRYRITRLVQQLRGEDNPVTYSLEYQRTVRLHDDRPNTYWESAGRDKAGSGKRYRTLEAVLEAASLFHASREGSEPSSNASAVLKVAARLGLVEGAAETVHRIHQRSAGAETTCAPTEVVQSPVEANGTPPTDTVTTTKGVGVMKVPKKAAAAMFGEIGLFAFENWSPDTWASKLKGLPKLFEADPESRPTSDESKELALAICTAVAAGEEIELVDAEENGKKDTEMADEKTRAPKAKKPKAAKKKARKAAKAKVSSNGKAGKMSAIDAAAKVLAQAHRPMGCQEMIESMGKKGYWQSPGGKTPAATLYSKIIREIGVKGKHSRFKKTAPGKFATKA